MIRAIDDFVIDRLMQPIADAVQDVGLALRVVALGGVVGSVVGESSPILALPGVLVWVFTAWRWPEMWRQAERKMQANRCGNPLRVDAFERLMRAATLALFALAATPTEHTWLRYAMDLLIWAAMFVGWHLIAVSLPSPREHRALAENPWLATGRAP